MNSMQMYDNVLTEGADLVSLSKDKAANSICSWLSLWFLFNLFFFHLIKSISVQPLVSQLFLHFGALTIQITSYLLSSKLPSSISSPTPFLVSFLTPFPAWFSPNICQPSICIEWFLLQQHIERKPPLGLSIWYHSASDQLWSDWVSVVLLLQIWSWTFQGERAEDNNSKAYKEGQMFIRTKTRSETGKFLPTTFWEKDNY